MGEKETIEVVTEDGRVIEVQPSGAVGDETFAVPVDVLPICDHCEARTVLLTVCERCGVGVCPRCEESEDWGHTAHLCSYCELISIYRAIENGNKLTEEQQLRLLTELRRLLERG